MEWEESIQLHINRRLATAVRVTLYSMVGLAVLRGGLWHPGTTALREGLIVLILLGTYRLTRLLHDGAVDTTRTIAVVVTLTCMSPSFVHALTIGATVPPWLGVMISALAVAGYYLWGVRAQATFVAGSLIALAATRQMILPRHELVAFAVALATSIYLAGLLERYHRLAFTATAALRNEHAAAKRLSMLRERFLRVISHELRTPMTVIQTATDALARYWERLDPVQRKTRIARIDMALGGMQRTLDDVVTLSRDERPRPAPVRVDVDAVVGATVRELATLGEPVDRLDVVLPSTPLTVWTDAEALAAALRPLLLNALRYSAPETRVRVTLESDDAGFRLLVHDAGIGVPPAEIDAVFEPFTRGTNATHVGGIGIGLATATQAADRMGARITLSPGATGGTIAALDVPRHHLSTDAPRSAA